MRHAYFHYNGTNGFYGRDDAKRVDNVDYVYADDVKPLVDALKLTRPYYIAMGEMTVETIEAAIALAGKVE